MKLILINDQSKFYIPKGEVGLFKLKKRPETGFEMVWIKREHDGIVLSLATKFMSNNAVSGCDDGR